MFHYFLLQQRRNERTAMSAAFGFTSCEMQEYQRFKDRDTVRLCESSHSSSGPPRRAKVLGSTTRTDYRSNKLYFRNKRMFMCTRGSESLWNTLILWQVRILPRWRGRRTAAAGTLNILGRELECEKIALTEKDPHG